MLNQLMFAKEVSAVSSEIIDLPQADAPLQKKTRFGT